MQALTITRTSSPAIRPQRPRVSSSAMAGAAGLAAAILFLLALLPAMAAADATRPAGGPAPLPAPGPAIVTGIDFPEGTQPGGACTAIFERSSAVDNARSQRAGEITSLLLADACLGA